ncbi:YadA-like family protein, partial [uncultured Megasphaera sp.]|uniref:YadA-like family protein n=1 Tax=uncultured Megasphaera sp. TaxID=165188 RepID=UPI00261B0520
MSNKKGDKPSPAFTDEYWNAVWTATANPMAIGNADTDASGKGEGHNGHGVLTRQITGVAAGTDLTDAVNVAQLKAAIASVNNSGESGTGGDGVHYYSVSSNEQGPGSNYDNKGATGANALAAGVSASATGAHSVAVGNGATAKGQDSIALGTGAVADGIGATVIGQYNVASGQNALAFGGGYNKDQKRNTASGVASVAFGEGTQAIAEGTLAFGENTQAGSTEKDKNDNPLGQNAVAFGNGTKATGGRSLAFGERTVASANDATAFGNESVASGTGATAFGNKNQATGLYATAWGGGDKQVDNGDGTTKKIGTVASGTYATAFGERTEASGESATAFGSGSTASGKNAAAFGENSTASGEASTAFGIGSTAAAKNSLAALGGTVAESAENAVAIGNGAQAKLADTVALGSGSIADRQSGVKGYDAAIGAETTQTSATWVSNANAIAVGNGSSLTRQITGVAAGSQDTDAVNLAQLKEVGKLAGKHTTVSVGGQKATADDTLVKGGNLELKRHTTDGQANYDVALSKDVILGEQEENKGGSLVVNSVAQFRTAPGSKETYPVKEAVKVDGTTVSVVKNDGTNDQRQVVLGVGQDTGGYVALFDKTGKTPTYIFNAISPGITYLKDSKTYPADEANEFKRLEYGDITNGSTQFIATLDDGLKFSGDQGTASAVKLNQKLSVTGGENNSDNLVNANNIGVVSSQDGENGKLEIKLNKDLTGLNTVTAGAAKIGHSADGALPTVQNGQPTGGHAAEGDYVTGLTNKEWTVKNPTYVSGRAATEDELRTVSDAVSSNTTNITNNTTQITNNTNTIAKGLSFTTNTKDATNTTENYKGYKVVKRSLGDTIAIKASDEADGHDYSTANLTTRIAENGDISILMDEKPTFTTVTTGDVIYTGNPDKKDNNGKAAQADTSVHYGDKTLTDGKNITTSDNETKATRLGYQDAQDKHHDIATMDDGQIYAGDIKTDGTLDSNGFARTMNQKTTINGGVKSKDSLTDGNIGVVSNGTDTLTVKLAKELKDLTSVTTGKTVQNDSGITITNDANDETKNVVINGDKISYGGNQVTNMGSGINTATNQYDITTNGANIGDVKNIANSTTEAAKLTGDSNITVTYNDQTADGKNTVKLNDSITLGSDANKKVTIDGTQGTITAGDKVSFDGSTGKGSIGGVTIGNQTGVATTKKDGDKARIEDGTFVTGLTNTTWNPDVNGIVSGRAATEDQLKTVSDTVNAGWELDVNGSKQKAVTPTSPKVNFVKGQNITISGSGDDVTVATADDVRFASVRVGGDVDSNGGYTGGIVIGKQSGGASANPDENDYITGLKNIDWDATKIQSGRAATEDQLKKVAEDIKQGTVSGDVYVTGGEVTYHTDGGTDNGQPTVNDGTGKLTLTENNKTTTVDITGLHDYYATSGTVSEDGKKLTISRNERDKDGNPVTFDVDLTNLLNKEKHLIANPAAGSNGVYKVNEQGEVTLQVQDAAGNNTPVTISGFEGVVDHYKGLNFDANTRTTTDGKAYNVKMGGTIKVQGIDPVSGHDYSADNVTTEVDANGNITIKLDKALTADTVMVNGKDGRDGQIGLNGKDGKDGTVTAIIRTIGKNGTDGTDGKPGVNGTDGITRIVYQDGKDGEPGTTTHTVATLDDGLKFGANVPAAGKTDNPVGSKLNSTINIKGAGTKTLDQYSGKNLITSVEQDTDGNTTIQVLMDKNISADGVTVGQAGKDGVAGADGEIGKAGSIGINGKDGKDGITTTIIRTEKGQPGADGKNGKPGVDGADITRIVYQNGQDGTDGKDIHTVATLDDGLKFAGDDGQKDTTKVISKKLNEQLDIIGGANLDSLTDNNIGVKNKDGKLYVRLAKHVDLDNDGTLKAGNATFGAFSNTQLTTNKNNHALEGSYATGLSNKDWSVADPEYVSGRAATEDQLKVVSDAIHNRQLVNTDYQLVRNPNTDDGSYTATNGELTLTVRDTEHTNDSKYPDKTITIKDIASKTKVDEAYDRTVKYDMNNGKVDKTHVTFEATDADGNPLDTQVSHMASGASEITDDGKGNKTYTYNTDNNAANIGDVKKLADSRKTTVKSTDGSVSVVDKNANDPNATSHDYDLSVDTSKVAEGVTLKYKGDNNTQGSNKLSEAVTFSGTANQIVTKAENGKVTFGLADNVTTQTITAVGQDGKDGQIGLTGKNGADGSVTTIIKTVGAKGTDGKDGIPGVDGQPGKDGITRLVYDETDDKGGTEHHVVATLDDGLKFVGNDGQEVTRKLNETLSIKGGLSNADVANASSKNLGVRKSGDGLEIVMTDTPDFTKVTVGGDNKITIGGQTNSDTKNPANGNYITGLDNTKWDKDHVTENRAATEGQLRDVAGSITNEANGGGFALSSDEKGTDKVVKQDLGRAIQIKGDTTYKADGTVEKAGNIKTSVDVDNKAIKVELNKDVNLGKDGSIKAGETTINSDGVETNKIKVGDITITDQGINGGSKQIINIASGIDGKQYVTEGDNNAASIGDVKKIAGEEAGKAAEAVKSKSGKNITVKDDHTVNLNDNITLGDDQDKTKQVAIDGNGAKVTAGDGANKVTMDGSKGQVVIGTGDSTMTLGKQENKAGDSNPKEGNFLNGLDNRKWDGGHIQNGRAATEDQLKTVSDKVDSGRVFQGDDGKEVKVGMGDTLKIQGGVKAEDVSQENNIGIVKGADDTLNIRLAKDLKGLDSVTTGNTTINNGGLTVKGDDNHKDITIQQGNVNMGGNTISGVADGKVSKDSTDAVNGSQLWQRDQAINGLSGSVNKLGNRINRVGAGAAALAALHPLDFDPDDKWDFAAGYGNYRGANAAAIGAYYRPNEDTMFSVGGSFGGGENMVNAGVSIKLGQGNHVSTSRVAMAKEMKAMRQHMAEQDALIAKLQSMHGMAVDPAKSVLFPDVAENHWAYQYVTT